MKKTLFSKLENMMTAITFAEAGEHETALKMMDERPAKMQRKRTRCRQEKRVDHRPVLMA